MEGGDIRVWPTIDSGLSRYQGVVNYQGVLSRKNYVPCFTSDQLHNVYQVEHWLRKHKWCWSLLFLGRVLFLVNAYIIYKTFCEEGKVKPMSNYDFRHMVCLVNSEPTNLGGYNLPVSEVQCRGII